MNDSADAMSRLRWPTGRTSAKVLPAATVDWAVGSRSSDVPPGLDASAGGVSGWKRSRCRRSVETSRAEAERIAPPSASAALPDWRLMVLLAVDWATIASFATGVGTLVLAVATFSAVRSSNRSARVAEAALQEQRRPVLAPSRLEDPKQKIMFLGGHWVSASGGHAAVEHIDGVVYLAISLRNVGSGIAVCQGWIVRPGEGSSLNFPSHAPLEEFRLQSRDLYVPASDIGMWQGALRNPDDPVRAWVVEAIETGQQIMVELLYSDQVGRQRTISRFHLIPTNDTRIASLTRHWYLDWEGPRPESLTLAAGEAVFRDDQIAAERRAELERAELENESAAADTGGPVDQVHADDAAVGTAQQRGGPDAKGTAEGPDRG
jgi:hypothetical protein